MSIPQASAASATWLVAKRELTVHLRSKAAIISTAIITALIVGGLIAMKFFGGADAYTLGTTETADSPAIQAVVAELEANEHEVTIAHYNNVDRLTVGVEEGSVDAGLIATNGQLELIVHESPATPIATAVTNSNHAHLLNEITQQAAGTDVEALLKQLNEPIAVEVLNPPSEVDGSQVAVGFIVGFLLYLGIFGGGMAVAQGVVEEKSSRVIEVLLATVRPWQLLAGKVIGIGLASITQVAVYVTAAIVTAKALGIADNFSFDIAQIGLWVLVWFLIGYIVYALIFAALGALVSRQEDLGSVIPIPMMLVIIAYMIGVSVAPNDPDSPIVTIASYVPFTSPIVMPIRSAYGVASTTEVLIALAIGIISIPLLHALTTKIYSNGVRRSGVKIKLRDALKGA
ncbi:ABC transporter permease [Timonella sp. A28]|uniref:ABC transporter permease n=1 Tax=Timonella sp. A28 TaxID=3442640 RepID=UPI003EBA9963